MAWPRFRRWAAGIQGQLVLGLLAVVVVITLANTLVSSYLHSRFFSETLDADTRQRVVGLARSAAGLLDGSVTTAQLAEPLRAQLDSPSVRSIALYDARGRERFAVPADLPDGGPPPDTAEVAHGVVRHAFVTPDGAQIWRYLAPVRGGDGAVRGVLRMDLSLEILSTARESSIAVHLGLLLLLIAGGVALSLLAARRISAPIRQLARHAEAVSVTIPTTPVPAVGAREVRSLARALNRMLRGLRHSMARLRESEARYRGLFDRMPDVGLELDRDGRILAVNEAVQQLGWKPTDVQGQPLSVLVADADAARVMNAVAHAVRTGQLTTTAIRLRTDGAEPRFGELRAALRDRGVPPDGDGDRGPRLVAILRDVTERKRADDDVAHAQRVLSIHTLAAGISHEFNNVMATIIGTGSLLATRPDLPEEVARELNRIVATARRGASLSAQVLTYARRTVEQRAACDLGGVAHDTMELLDRTLDKRIEIFVDFPSALPPVQGDPTRLQQVLLNLGINAGDAMAESGGSLTIEGRPRRIQRKTDADRWGVERGEYVHVLVRDTGVGMDRAVLERAFEPYFTTKRAGEGTGLGLSVVYGTIRGLGGAVEAESEPGEGTTFHLLLPVAADGAANELAPAATATGETPVAGVAGTRRRPTREEMAAVTGNTILVVEDEPDLRELAQRVLERRGYHIHTAADGFEAESVMRDRGADLDLVLLDVNLPRRDGVETFEVLRRLRGDLPVVIVSAGGVTDRRISDLLRRGALAFLKKPYEFEELEEIVVQALTARGDGVTGEHGVA